MRRLIPVAFGVLCSLILTLSVIAAGAHGKGVPDYLNPEPEAPPFDETSVFVNVQRVGGTEMSAVIKDRVVYLPATNLFDFLKIKNIPSPDLDSVTGFFIDAAATFCIDATHGRITYMGRVTQLRPEDIIRTESNFYLKHEYFNHVFGLTCSFDFSNLSVKISTTYDLPAVRDMQLEQMHRNISRLKGETKADTIIGRTYPMFRMGIADYSLSSTQRSDGNHDLRATVSLGTAIAGGEANITLNYTNMESFNERQQFYQWRFANNDLKGLRQVTLGRIFTQSTSSVFDPVVGVQVTNTPTTYRRSYGTYRLSRMTQPGWTVELYVNSILVDFTKADASGFFSFDVPLVYGNSNVKLRYYGLYGEVRTSEENIVIPFNFLPKGELEYTASAGIVEDGKASRFGRASFNYGLNKYMTIGGGTEYLSSVSSGKNMPYMLTSLRLSSNLLLSGEYTYGVRGKAMLTYRVPGNGQLELNYTKFARDQKAIIYNYLEDRKVTFSMPIPTRRFGMVTRFMFNQIVISDHTTYTTAEWMLSGAFRQVNASINTYMIDANQHDPPKFDPYIYSNASLSFRLPKGYTVTPQAQYSYKDKSLISVKCEMEKFLFRNGYANLSLEQNFKSNFYSIGAGIRYDLSGARVGVSARQYNRVTSVTESVAGSFMYDSRTAYHGFANRPSVGRAGITILPFLDKNGNGRRDRGEQKVDGLKVRINSGRIEYSKRDTVIRLYDLEPYTNYFIDVSQNSFEHIGWQIRNKTMNVAVDPNQFKLIEVPVSVMAEGSGTVYKLGEKGLKAQGRISVCFYREDGSKAGCSASDPEGYFSYMGLKPGAYTVQVDAGQLQKLQLQSLPASRAVTIEPSDEGMTVDGLDFTLQPLPAAAAGEK